MSFINASSSFQVLISQANSAERAYIGCLLMAGTLLEAQDIRITPEEIYTPELAIILDAILELHRDGIVADMITVRQKLIDKKKFYPDVKTIDNQFLSELMTSEFMYMNLRKYESLVKENALKIRTQRIIDKMMEDTERNAGNILAYGQDLIALATNGMGNGGRGFDMKHAHNLADKIAELDGKELYGYSFGKEFKFLDSATKGIQKGKTYRIGAPSNTGKAMPYYERVLTPNGFTNIGSLKIGDKVNNSYGGVSTVTGVFPQGVKPIYRMRFSDGTFVDSCENHLWAVHNNDWSEKDYKIMEVKDIIKSGVRRGKWGYKFSVPLTDKVYFYDRNTLMIEPYVMGILLSEGNFGKGHIQITNGDENVKKRVESLLPNGDNLSYYNGGTITYGVVGGNTLSAIRSYGLDLHRSWEKFIPEDYIFSTPTERKELLEGLIDGDGWIDKTAYVYTTTSNDLAEGACTIARSLGGLVTIRERRKKFSYKGEKKEGKVSYDVRITLPFNLNLSVDYKNDIKKRGRALRKSIVDIEYIGELDCICIAVDAKDHLYITSGFTLTHNTQFAYSVINNLLAQGAKVAFFTLENEVETTLGYLMSNHQRVSMDSIMRGTSDGDFDYIEKINRNLAIFDSTFYLSDIFSKIVEFNPDVVILDYIGLMSIRGFREDDKYTEYAVQVQRFVKQIQVSWIDLSNLPTQLQQSEDIRGNPQFYGSTFLRNNTDVGIHIMPWSQFYDMRDRVLQDDIYDYETKNKLKRLSGVTMFLSKNRLGPHSISGNFIVDFQHGAEFTETSAEQFKSLASSFGLG